MQGKGFIDTMLKVAKSTNPSSDRVDAIYATVKAISPLSVEVEKKLVLTSEFLIYPSWLQGYLNINDKVTLVRVAEGQKYLVVDGTNVHFGGGGTGGAGWTPILANVPYADRVVMMVYDWTGGTGEKPPANVYVGAAGFTNDINEATDVRGAKGERGEQGQRGATGAKGADGAAGQAATIAVGQIVTGEAGVDATVVNSGTESNAVLDFVIPRGADGDSGVYLGVETPPDSANVWIDPNASAVFDPWPVGSVYIGVNDINPAELFGGTWVSFGAGRVLVGVDKEQAEFADVEREGGSKYLAKHRHGAISTAGTGGGETAATWTINGAGGANNVNFGYTGTEGTGDAGNLQPYITCYMWKRIA